MAEAETTDHFLLRHQADVLAARERIGPYVRRTPLLPSELDAALFLKPECWQVTGSFKARGAFNALLCRAAAAPDLAGVITVSSGNHAQALALAARTLGLRATVVIPEDANPLKVEATRALGAEVIQTGVTFDNRLDVAERTRLARGLEMIHPFDDWEVISGQGTAATEILSDEPRIQSVVAPVGGGGLLAGTAIAAKGHDRRIRVVGVEPSGADDARISLASGSLHRLSASPATMADGLRSLSIGERNFQVLVERGLADEIVTVDEGQIAEATELAWTRLKLALEPSGAVPLAAFVAGKLSHLPRPLALILSGGNFDPAGLAKLLGET
ncbi:MAG TPA: threonine/serine dehydratase [Candidatus Acidoferrales bacterium]|nr:threonine/serine dehydratase [Candidatus Acidoferrales bacterium]